MGFAPCGCDLIADAESKPPASRTRDETFGAEMQENWQCPLRRDSTTPPEHDDELAPQCRETLRACTRLTGATGFTTCPGFYARLPWVHRAARARRWAERGELRLVEGDASLAMVDAIDAIDAGMGARAMDDAQRMRDAAEEAARKRGA